MTKIPANKFGEIAKLAVLEGTASKQELGRSQAAEFFANPNTFDPQQLILLGRPGLRAFADVIGVKSTRTSRHTPPATTPPPTQPEEAGWSAQQARNAPFELIGMALGILSGFFLIITISLRVWLYG